MAFLPLMIVLVLLNAQLILSQCVDESGQPVDWYVLYKLPKLKAASDNSHIAQGLGYTFFTSKSVASGFTLSKHSINDSSSIVAKTLEHVYSTEDAKKDTFSLFYNDEHPDGKTSFTDGHTKGVVVLGQDKGYWLVHSVPKFPPSPESGPYAYVHSGETYGQSFLCISLDTRDSADAIGQQLLFNRPYIYSTNLPQHFEAAYPQLSLASKGKHIKDPPYHSTATLKSLFAHEQFTSFAKYTKFHKDLYADLVAPSLQAGLYTETWPNGPGKMPSSCKSKFRVENIDALNFKLKGVNFTTKHDHAKWAISMDEKRPYLCIGDINRMNTQLIRAGGTVCFLNKTAWKAFGGIIETIEVCPKQMSWL